MTYAYSRLYDKIIAAVDSEGSIADRMQVVINECAEQRPHSDWSRLANIDFNADDQKIELWLGGAILDPTATHRREGLWFGLFNPIFAGKPTADIYVSAAPDYDQVSIEWACDIEKRHAGSCLESKILKEIYSIAYESSGGLNNDAEYPLVLAYGGIVAHTALLTMAATYLSAEFRGAAVGFDSGDFLFLGDFDNSKFVSKVRAD
jgi:hypothetical protein